MALRRPVSGQPLKDGRGRPCRIHAVGLLVLQREDPLVAEAAIDPVPYERQFHHLGGESLDRFACGSTADPCRLADRELAVADRAQPCRLVGVTRPAATMPGSLAATTVCSLRRLRTPSTIASAKIGTIQNT